jgi:hypothetical protein
MLGQIPLMQLLMFLDPCAICVSSPFCCIQAYAPPINVASNAWLTISIPDDNIGNIFLGVYGVKK